jgi:hypothetical protein
MVWTRILRKTSLVTALAGGLLLFSGVPNVHAIDRESCYQNVRNWERKLGRDVDLHGVRSWRARHDRHELDEARLDCRRRFGSDWRVRYRYYR